MAVYYNLGLVARTQQDAQACAAYFASKRLVIDAIEVPLEISETEIPGGWLVGVWPRGMSYGSPKTNDHRLTTEDARAAIAAEFDAWLRDAPPFAAAFFGGEAYDYFLDNLSELTGPFEALVCDEAMWQSFGAPADAIAVGEHRYAWPRTRAL